MGYSRSNNISGEGSAILLLSEIFEAGTDDLLGETMLSVVGTGVPDPNTAIDLVGSDRIGLDTDAIRVRTFGLVVGGTSGAKGSFAFVLSRIRNECCA